MVKDEDAFTFETIAQVYREERNSAILTKLPIGFYRKLASYLKKLQVSYFEARQKDPNSSKTMMLEDEFHKSQNRASEIYERRERKVVLLSLSAANGGNPDITVLTVEEKNSFNNIFEVLKRNRYQILEKEEDVCESNSFIASEKKSVKIDEGDEISITDIKVEEKKEVVEEKGFLKEDSLQENPVLLILEDIPSFETDERIFNLKKDDTITLPREYANILCKHKKARVIQN